MAEKAVAEETNEVAPQKKVKAKPVKQEPVKPQWEIKDRTYLLRGKKTPLTYTLNSKHTRKYAMLWFDQETGKQEELRYATNQSSPLVSEQKGEVTLGHIIFREGVLTVPKEKQNLQKLLSLYHPGRNRVYQEFNPVEVAKDDLDIIDLQIDAMTAARNMDVDFAEAIMRVEVGSNVAKMSSKEIKRDLLIFARTNPQLFLELANDENVQLRNFAINASDVGIIKLSPDQRHFTWGSNGRKLMEVPFDENPYSAFAAFLKTDEGVQVYKSIEKKLL
jgi:hypothetical protein